MARHQERFAATTNAETEELAYLREELARERQRRIEAEREMRRAMWHVLDELSRKLPLLLAWVDRDCRFHFANERYAALFAQTPESILKLTLREFYGETIWSRIEGHVQRALSGERVEFDVNDPALEDPCLFRVTYVPDRDAAGEVRGFFLSLYDVKEVRRAERASAFLAEAMPECDGYDLLARLQERGPVRALAVSAFGRGEERQRIAASGFAGYVQKPVEAAALVRAVAALFEEEQAR